MVGIEGLDEVIQTVIFSAYLEDERPLSALLAAKVESGKSTLLSRYHGIPGLQFFSDVTAWGITHRFLRQLINGEIRHLVIPDLVVPLARNRDTVGVLVAFLNALIEEGAISLHTYATKVDLKDPIRCGLIAALAKEELDSSRRTWMRIGFMSRLLPVSYSYTPKTVTAIRQSIASQSYQNDNPIELVVPKERVRVKLPKPIADRIMVLTPSVAVAAIRAERIYGFRLQRQLQTFCMAHALRRGADIATDEDYEATAEFTSLLNLQYVPI